jgi:hypothetical protein
VNAWAAGAEIPRAATETVPATRTAIMVVGFIEWFLLTAGVGLTTLAGLTFGRVYSMGGSWRQMSIRRSFRQS